MRHSSALLVIEDVHWADDATLDLIKYLGRRIDQTRALLVLTYRDDELSAQHPLRTVIGDLPGTTIRLPLARLSEAAVAALALAANHPARAHELFAATNGNPFFVTEVLASQRDEVPITVRDAVMARAARLSLSGHATLEAAAVIGPRIELQLLSELTSAEAPMVEECISAGMLYAQGAVLAFRHELARQTILASISPQRKQSLHSLTVATLRADRKSVV